MTDSENKRKTTTGGGGFEIIIKKWGGRKCLFKRGRNKEGAEVETLIMDCLVTLLAADEEGNEYLLSFEGADGRRHLKILDAHSLSSPTAMRELIRPYTFLGGQTEIEYLLMFWRGTGGRHKLVKLTDYMGRRKDDLVDFWVLADGVHFAKGEGKEDWSEVNMPDTLIAKLEAIKAEGAIQPTSQDMYISFPEGGTRAVDLVVGDRWYYIENPNRQPDMELMTRPAGEPRAAKEMETNKLIEGWGTLYGNPYMVYIVLGWFCAIMYMDEVLEMRGSKKMPLLALSGLTQSGKTSLVSLLMRFWGVEARPSDYTQVSLFADLKQLQMAHNFPIWRDEYRSIGRAQEKESMLRSLYDRSAVYRGTASQELKAYGTGGTFLLSGEGVTLDPAIRRRFVYWELQDRFKLKGDDWIAAEDWASDYAPEMFYRAIDNGFNCRTFMEIWTNEKKEMRTVNDVKEERLCIAALGAVFGKELGEMVLEMGVRFWDRERLNFDGIDRLQMTIAEKFFIFIDSLFTMSGGYLVKEFMGSTIPPMVLNYFSLGQETLYIKIVPLIQLAFDKGFGKMTTLDAYAVKGAIKAMQLGKDTTVRLGGVSARVIAVRLEDIEDEMALAIIADNVISIVDKVRSNGRSIGEEEKVEEIANSDIEKAGLDPFLLLSHPATNPSKRKRRTVIRDRLKKPEPDFVSEA